MDRDTLLKMDSYMALSIVNMKLRDEFSSLEDFALYCNIETKEIQHKLSEIGYEYDCITNRFISMI
ncbi:DUF4250 domain-containing protein [Clostridium sp. UBA4548]|uniref:DUF4250 domain-containing protein n=1 Tax=Clostridium sp. UBA4548 TaxID=1946361 RepID=UPI0025BC64EA|nr:DUF4250 domain-containing protein [Clostridium sp. UBA4548]